MERAKTQQVKRKKLNVRKKKSNTNTINLDCIKKKKKNIKENNPNWLQISDHAYRILITGGFYQEKQMRYLI